MSSEPIQIIQSKDDHREKLFHPSKKSQIKIEPVWTNILIYMVLHYQAFYGLYYILAGYVSFRTFLWTYLYGCCSVLGSTGGAHRLWAHCTYKANLPLRILLCIFQTISLQNNIFIWSRDHRLHHKYTDTNADPHNASRGFFFSHMGWLLVKKHPDVLTKGRLLDLSDLLADPVVVFQKKYYPILAITFSFLIPSLVPWYFWGENIHVSWCFCAIFRYILTLHGTWCVNSAAHLFGTRPYDKGIMPRENMFVVSIAMGEGWHNYHHVFPWDYKAAELGNETGGNFTALFIETMAKIGWAYNLKTVSKELIEKRVKRTGDGTRESALEKDDGSACNEGTVVWGWNDANMDKNDRKLAEILHEKIHVQ